MPACVCACVWGCTIELCLSWLDARDLRCNLSVNCFWGNVCARLGSCSSELCMWVGGLWFGRLLEALELFERTSRKLKGEGDWSVENFRLEL